MSMLPISPAEQDLAAREPVWEALAAMYLDTDTSLSRRWRARQLAASPYSIEQLEIILEKEVNPICRYNLCSVAGEWEFFDNELIKERILRRLRSPFKALFAISLTRPWILASSEWFATRAAILAARGHGIAAES